MSSIACLKHLRSAIFKEQAALVAMDPVCRCRLNIDPPCRSNIDPWQLINFESATVDKFTQ